MNSLYKFVNDKQIQLYKGEILTKHEGDKITRVVSNPTDTNLKEFGYMQLVTNDEIPEYDPSTQSVEISYVVKDNKICQSYQVVDITEVTTI